MTKFLLGFFSFGWLRGLDFLPPLLFRLFLAPLLWVQGKQNLGLFTNDNTQWYNPLTWFNTENSAHEAVSSSLSSLPFIGEAIAGTLTTAIGALEVVGAFLLLIGFAVRWISLPLLALIGLTALIALNGQDIIATFKDMLLTHGYKDMSSTDFSKLLIYFLMLLSLFFMGAGRFFSVDWFLHRRLQKRIKVKQSAKNTRANPTEAEDPFELDNTTD
ncbi:MAG: DoxX family protein [Cocleimonas sp.]